MDETVENGDKLSEGQNRTHPFFTGCKNQPLNPIPLGSKRIQFTSATNNLGIFIDNKLSFEDHGDKMATKM